uniref:Uncharacterized protein n=1 Tax=uncultured Flavobacteriia bacterium TaxID=212695 RepID=H6RHM1_9BACT|nr:conserved hypothetical protein [uncultured Flavobacteriia bacterium]
MQRYNYKQGVNYFLFTIIKAAIIPGIHPQIVSNPTIRTEPQPLSKTANGGKKIATSALKKLIILIFDD